MTEKERIKRWIHFQGVDSVPWHITYTSEMGERLMKVLGLEIQEHDILGKNIYRFNELENYLENPITIVRTRAVNSVQEVTPGIWQDEWGVLWDRTVDKDIGVPVQYLLESMQLDHLAVPDPLDPQRYAHFDPMIAINPHRYILGKFSYSFFERAWSLRGMENLLTDFILNPSFVHELFKIILDYDLKILQHLVNFPIDGVFFTDDWGSQRGLLMSPATWRKFIKPYMQRLYDQAHQQGYDVFIHSCGNNSLIIDDLIEIGVNVFNPFQPEVINVEEVMQRYSHKLAFYGSLSIQHTLPFGTPDDVRREVEHRLRFAQQYGGLIISPAHDMPPDIPTENVLTMLNTLRSQ